MESPLNVIVGMAMDKVLSDHLDIPATANITVNITVENGTNTLYEYVSSEPVYVRRNRLDK